MSDTRTTQETPQWAMDAATRMFSQYQEDENDYRDLPIRDIQRYAAIIAKHAQARIAELEADNKRLRRFIDQVRVACNSGQKNGNLQMFGAIAVDCANEIGD